VPAWSERLEFLPNWADKTALSQILAFLDLCLDLPNVFDPVKRQRFAHSAGNRFTGPQAFRAADPISE